MTRRLFSSILVAVLAFCAMPHAVAAQKTESLATYTNGVLASPTNFFDANSNAIVRVAGAGNRAALTNNYTDSVTLKSNVVMYGGLRIGSDWTNVAGSLYGDYSLSSAHNQSASETSENGITAISVYDSDWSAYGKFDSKGSSRTLLGAPSTWATTQGILGNGKEASFVLSTAEEAVDISLSHNTATLVRIAPTVDLSIPIMGDRPDAFLFNTDWEVSDGTKLFNIQELGVSRFAISSAGHVVIGTNSIVFGNGNGLTNIPFAGVVGVLDATNTLWQATTNLVGVSSNSLAQSIAASTNNYAGILTNMTLSWSGKHTFGNVVTNSADVYMEGALHLGGDLLGTSAVTASGGFYGLDGGVTNASGQTILAQIKADGALNTNEVLRVGGLSTNHVYLIGANDTNHVHAIGANTTNHVWAIGANATNHAYKIGANDTNETLRVGALTTNHVWKIGSESTNETARVGALATNHVAKVGGDLTNEVTRVGGLVTNHVDALQSRAVTNGHTEPVSLSSSLSLTESGGHLTVAGNQTNTGQYLVVDGNLLASELSASGGIVGTHVGDGSGLTNITGVTGAVTNNYNAHLTLKSNLVVEGIMITGGGTNQIGYTSFTNVPNGSMLYQRSDGLVVGTNDLYVSNLFAENFIATNMGAGVIFGSNIANSTINSNKFDADTIAFVLSGSGASELTNYNNVWKATNTFEKPVIVAGTDEFTNTFNYTEFTNGFVAIGDGTNVLGYSEFTNSLATYGLDFFNASVAQLFRVTNNAATGGERLEFRAESDSVPFSINWNDGVSSGISTPNAFADKVWSTNGMTAVGGVITGNGSGITNITLVSTATNDLWQATTNLVGVASNSLAADIIEMSGGGVTADTATNIAAYQAKIATNGLSGADLSNATNEVLRVGALTTNHVYLIGANTTNEVLRVGGLATNHTWKVGGDATNEVARAGGVITNHVWKIGGEATNEVSRAGGVITNHVWKVGGETTNEVLRVGSLTTNHVYLIGANDTNEVLRIGGLATNHVALATNDLWLATTNAIGIASNSLAADIAEMSVGGVTAATATNIAAYQSKIATNDAVANLLSGGNTWTGTNTHNAPIIVGVDNNFTNILNYTEFTNGLFVANGGTNALGKTTFTNVSNSKFLYQGSDGVVVGSDAPAADLSPATNHVWLVGGNTTNETLRVGDLTTNHVWKVGGEATNEVARVGGMATNHTWKVGGETTNHVAASTNTLWQSTTNLVGISSNALQQAITSLTGGGITMADVRNQGMITNNNAGAVTLLSSLSLTETGGNLLVAGNQTNTGQYLTVDGVMLVSGITNSGNFSGTLYGDVYAHNFLPQHFWGLKVVNDTNLADSVTAMMDQVGANHATAATNQYAGIFTNRAAIAWSGGHTWAGAGTFAGVLTAQNGVNVQGDITCDSTIGAAGFQGYDEGITNAAGQGILAQIQADGANNTNEVLRVGVLTTNHVHKTGANDTNHVWLVGGNSTNHVHKIGGNDTNEVLRVGALTTNHVWKVGAEATNYCITATNTIKYPVTIGAACSDETTALTTGTKVTFRMPHAMTLTGVRASLTTAQSTGNILTVDIHEGGTTIMNTTKITIDNAEKTSTTAVAAPALTDTALADDAEMTVDIDQVGDGTAKGLKVWLIGYRTY